MIRSRLHAREARAIDPSGGMGNWDSLSMTGIVPPHGFDTLNRAGVNVTPKTVLSIGVVQRCCEVLQNAFFVMGRPRPYRTAWDKDGYPYIQWIAGSQSAFPSLLNAPWGTAPFADNAPIPYNVGIGRTIVSMALFGEAWWLITARDYYGNASALEVLHPAFIDQGTIGQPPPDGKVWYGMGASRVALDVSDLVHIPRLILPGDRSGLSPVKTEAPLFAIAIAAVQYSQMWFAQGGQPSYVLSTDKKLGQDEIDRIFEHLLLEHSGLSKAYTPLILDSGLKPEITQIDPEKSQMHETLQYVRTEIAGYFGIPLHLVGATGDSGGVWGKGIQEENYSFLDFTISGYRIPIEEAFTQVTPRGQFVGLDYASLLRANSLDNAHSTLANRTAAKTTPNEERRVDGLPPLPGGDSLLTPLNSNAPAVSAGGTQLPGSAPPGDASGSA